MAAAASADDVVMLAVAQAIRLLVTADERGRSGASKSMSLMHMAGVATCAEVWSRAGKCLTVVAGCGLS